MDLESDKDAPHHEKSRSESYDNAAEEQTLSGIPLGLRHRFQFLIFFHIYSPLFSKLSLQHGA